MERNLEIRIRDSIFDPRDVSAAPEWRLGAGEGPLYKVHIFLEGNDLLFVRGATYILHETFAQPVRTVTRSASNPNCLLTIWTWGIFPVRVIVEDKRGQKFEFEHLLTYGADIEKTPRSLFRSAS